MWLQRRIVFFSADNKIVDVFSRSPKEERAFIHNLTKSKTIDMFLLAKQMIYGSTYAGAGAEPLNSFQ